MSLVTIHHSFDPTEVEFIRSAGFDARFGIIKYRCAAFWGAFRQAPHVRADWARELIAGNR
jgi:hypothetical protein